MIWALLLVPAMAGLMAMVLRPNWPRRALLLLAAAAHTAPGGRLLGPTAGAGRQRLDGHRRRGAAVPQHHQRALPGGCRLCRRLSGQRKPAGQARHDDEEELPFVNFPEAVFAGCLLLFLATMTLVTVSRHLGLMWVGVEATTLASAPLIYFHRHHRSLEATWKYLLICSVGIALALLGNFFVAVAARSAGGPMIHLTIDDLVAHAGSLNPLWLKAAFLFFLVGYGTKMGLAPLHTWLPDAHSEAPSVVSALLSGALLNCAFLTILRTHSLLSAAGLAAFSSDLLVLFGLLSMAVAAVFILGQADFKRMLAYSSVEHMGILALGIGIGGAATFGAMLHAVNHSLDQGDVVPGGGQHPGPLPHQIDHPRPRRAADLADHGRALAGRFPGHCRVAAVRAVSQRVDDPQGRARRGPPAGGRGLLVGAGDRVRRHGDDLPAHGLRSAARFAGSGCREATGRSVRPESVAHDRRAGRPVLDASTAGRRRSWRSGLRS